MHPTWRLPEGGKGVLTESGVPARAQVVFDVQMDPWHACTGRQPRQHRHVQMTRAVGGGRVRRQAQVQWALVLGVCIDGQTG